MLVKARQVVLLVVVLAMAVLVFACKQDPEPGPDPLDELITDVDVELSPTIGTVVTVRWTTVEPSSGFVEVTLGGQAHATRWSVLEDATEHEVLLLGQRADTAYDYRVVAVVDGEDSAGVTGTFTTGPLPGVLQGVNFQVFGNDTAAFDGFLCVSLLGLSSTPIILDSGGHIVWWYREETTHPVITTVTLSRDGQSVLHNSFALTNGQTQDEHTGRIVRVAIDGSGAEHVELPNHHHDFVELPDGTIAFLRLDIREVDEEMVVGDAIIEIDPEGTQSPVWSAWDYFTYVPDPEQIHGTGWTHANALDYDEEDDAYYVSFRNMLSIVKIDRATGTALWSLGGPESDFEIVGTEPHSDQHEFQLLDGGILIFDNGFIMDLSSRALEYRLDFDAWTATYEWSYQTDPVLYVPTGGDVTRLDDGNTLVTWSSAGQVDLVDPSGELLWRVNTNLGHGFGFTRWLDDLYADPSD